MKRKTNYFLIGVFVLAGTALTVTGVVMLGAGFFSPRGLIVETYFTESVQGLEKGAVVRFRGVRIGTVQEIALASQLYDTGKPYAAIRCEIEPTAAAATEAAIRARVENYVASGFRMRLAAQGITGALYIETDVTPTDIKQPLPIDWQPKYFYVPSSPSRIEQLGNSLERVLANLSGADFQGLVEDARSTLRRVETAIDEADFGAFGREVRGVADDARGVLAQVRDEVSRVGTRFDSAANRVDGLLEAVSPEDLQRTSKALADFTAELPSTRARLDATLDRAVSLLDLLDSEVRGGSRDVGQILADLRRTAQSLANLAESAEAYPSALLLGTPPEPVEIKK